MVVVATNERFWARRCKALGLEELIDDPRFRTNVDRVRNGSELIPVLEKIFRSKGRDGWVKVLVEACVLCGPVYELRGV